MGRDGPQALHMGHRLLGRLDALGMSQNELSKRVRRSRQRVSQWTRQAEWQGKTIQLVAEAVGVGPAYFF